MMKPFSPEKLRSVLDALEKHRPEGRAVAAFDADGTLWSGDLGEQFFGYLIDNKLVPLPADPWGHYEHLKTVSHTVAYVWLAQILNGVSLERTRKWAEEGVAAKPLPVFEEQQRIFEKLKTLDVEIYIVTASIKWAVEPGARRLGLRDENVIGIETAVVDGVVTDREHGIVTYREGKEKAILARTGGLKPYFTSGNTEGDQWLLDGSSDLRLVMSSAAEGSENYVTEMKMIARAQERGWFWHRYV